METTPGGSRPPEEPRKGPDTMTTQTITAVQRDEIYDLTARLPYEVVYRYIPGYVSDMTAEQAEAVIPRLRAAVKGRPTTRRCHWCGMPTHHDYCDECGEQF